MSDAKLHGKCLCTAVDVTATPARASLSVCHCDMCRAWSSGMFMAFQAETGSVHATGPVTTFTSSEWAERAFCGQCGSPLWYRITADGPMHGQHQVSAGLFEDAGGMIPKLEVYIDRKPGGYALEGERTTMTEAEVMALYAPQGGERDDG